MSDRKLATIRRIQEVKPIDGADVIEAVRVDNWWVVAKKGEYPVDTLAVYCEIDSWIPNSLAPFLTKPGHFPKEFQGVQGERLKTIKLKGQLSQGLLLPLSVAFELSSTTEVDILGVDVTEGLGILKWEPPQEFMAANAKGTFPSFIPKTDQERIQNISQAQFQKWIDEGVEFERSEKIDGSSMTVFIKDGVVGVCSRNLELKEDEGNTFWKTAHSSGAVKALLESCKPVWYVDLAIQGELIGPGIQGNSYGLTDFEFLVYDVFNISNNQYLSPHLVRELAAEFGLKTVPIIEESGKIKSSVGQLLKDANGVSKLNPKAKREGDVYKAKNGVESFKVISDEWLIKTGK
jgi:RNA ligase (TIGR02306 family)